MKVAILTFFDVKLGGLGTQAWDFARLAQRAGHKAMLVNIEPRKSTMLLPDWYAVDRAFVPGQTGRGMKLICNKLGTGTESVRAEALRFLSQIDACIWVGVAPHIEEPERQTDLFVETVWDTTQEEFFKGLLDNGKRHVAFATDKFIDKYYAWIKPLLPKFSGVYAFAEPYAAALGRGVRPRVLPIAPLSAWDMKKNAKPSTKSRKMFWPHQWRGWKNIDMFLEMTPYLNVPEIRMYASGTGQVEYTLFRKTQLYKDIVRSDVHSEHHNPSGKITLLGSVGHHVIMGEYLNTATCPDLTGVTSGTHEASSYTGNYQCATLEAMLLGCALIKFTTTVRPHNGIPREAVLPLEPGVKDYAPQVNEYLKDGAACDRAAKAAFEWVQDVGEPNRCFKQLLEENT